MNHINNNNNNNMEPPATATVLPAPAAANDDNPAGNQQNNHTVEEQADDKIDYIMNNIIVDKLKNRYSCENVKLVLYFFDTEDHAELLEQDILTQWRLGTLHCIIYTFRYGLRLHY